MMFELNDEQKMIQDLARDFAEKVLLPTVEERDEKEIFDRSIYDKMGETGLTGITYPEQYGGSGLDHLSYVLMTEELSRVETGAASYIGTTDLAESAIYFAGTEEQKMKYLKPMAEGTALGSFALTEPNAGSDVAAIQTTAVLDGEHYVINGNKIFITNAGYSEITVLFAMTDKKLGHKGLSVFIIEKGMLGFNTGKKEKKMGHRTAPTMELILQDLRVPVENRLGQEGDGFKIAMHALDCGRIGIAAQGVGIASAALDHAVKYSKERVQFGKPICSFQAIQILLADMKAKVESARLLTYKAAWLKDNNKPYSAEAALAKFVATDAAMSVSTDAVQVFGGYGYITEYPVERLMRDAKITQIYEGSNQIQRTIVAKALTK